MCRQSTPPIPLYVAYDAEHEAGAYLLDFAGRRSQGFWLLLIVAYGVGSAGAVWALMSAQLFPAIVLICAAVCSAAAARDMTFASVALLRGQGTEADVRTELDKLRLDDYVVMHDFAYAEEEKVDHLVSGANGVFLIEASFDRYEPSQVEKARRQARDLSSELGCWVTPVICAGEREKSYDHEGVLVTGRGTVASEIRARVRGGRVDAERLRGFAARLN